MINRIFKPFVIQVMLMAIIVLQIFFIYSGLKQAREDYHKKEKNWAVQN